MAFSHSIRNFIPTAACDMCAGGIGICYFSGKEEKVLLAIVSDRAAYDEWANDQPTLLFGRDNNAVHTVWRFCTNGGSSGLGQISSAS
jgi:hypothetical protein